MTEITKRVERERRAHEEDDVLANAYALKERFSHVTQTSGYQRMESIVGELISQMQGTRVLDYGCGRGEMSGVYSDAGADVIGIDISQKYIEDANKRLPECQFLVMDAHSLDFPDKSFDTVIGRGILHHLDLLVALKEIHRVLKPGGRACFLEPLADNPLLKLFRLLTPHARTVDERPLSKADLASISALFHNQSYYFGMLSAPAAMLSSILIPSRPQNVLAAWAHSAESAVRTRGWLQSWHQYVLLDLIRVE